MLQMKHWMLILGAVALVLVAVGGWWGWRLIADGPALPPDEMVRYDGLRGPPGQSRVPDPPATPIEQFEVGASNRLAILVTDPASGWLGLVRGFRALGVPITVTQSVERALQHRVVLVYPIISGAALDGPELRGLARHAREGGTVVAFNLAGGGLDELFGVVPGAESTDRMRLRWTAQTGVAAADEVVVSGRGETSVASVGYAAPNARVEATFDDGSVAAACRPIGPGRTCVLGVDVGALAQRTKNGRAESMSRGYTNSYDPSVDTYFRWLRDIYVQGEPMPWLIDTVPAGRDVSIIFTHDVDFGPSITNSQAYADTLRAAGVSGTFFIQTKYMRDWNDAAFFDQAAAERVSDLVDMGMDVGSHTVAHSRELENMEMGSGRERYPSYRPRVTDDFHVEGATILGELRVSKWLLEELTGAEVVSFRPGRLSYPFELPEALNATGYRHSSSISANLTMSHLPFQLTNGRAYGALQPVFEYPVTLEDELDPPMGARLDEGLALIDQIARDRGLVVILTHPNVTDHKLSYTRGVLERWRERAWIGSLAQFGAWWSARDALEADLVQRNGRWELTARSQDGVRDLGIILPRQNRRLMLTLEPGRESRTAL